MNLHFHTLNLLLPIEQILFVMYAAEKVYQPII